MSDAQAKKGVSSKLLLTVFLLIALAVSVFLVKTFERWLAEDNAAREAEYAAEYAAIDAANPVEDTAAGEAAVEEAPGDAPPIMEVETAPAE